MKNERGCKSRSARGSFFRVFSTSVIWNSCIRMICSQYCSTASAGRQGARLAIQSHFLCKFDLAVFCDILGLVRHRLCSLGNPSGLARCTGVAHAPFGAPLVNEKARNADECGQTRTEKIRVCLCLSAFYFLGTHNMQTLKIEPASTGKIWVTLPYSAENVARIKKIPGHRWNPDRKQWLIPDTPKARKVLAEIVALPPPVPSKMIAVKPKTDALPPRPSRPPYVAGKSKPLTTNPPHPLIKKVDDELVLRNMKYGTRKCYGQHLRNYFKWLKVKPEEATCEDIRAYIVERATSGQVSVSYLRGTRSALVFLYETVLKQPGKVGGLPRMARAEQLPVVLSREEVVRLFKVTKNLKHKTLLVVAYSAGLRVGEVVRLRVGD